MIVLCVVLFSPSTVLGKSLYVRCSGEVGLRATPNIESEILATLKTGQELALRGETGEFYLVTLPNGTKGYVRKTYLTDQAPAETRLRDAEDRLRETEAHLQEIGQRTQQRIKELEAQTQAQEQELRTLREARAQLEAAKKKAETTASLQSTLSSQLQTQHSVVTQDRQDSKLRWFMAGAGILLTGWILGSIWGASRQRNRRLRF